MISALLTCLKRINIIYPPFFQRYSEKHHSILLLIILFASSQLFINELAKADVISSHDNNKVMLGWHEDMLDWQTSPVDLSFLNKQEQPAGKHGFLKTNGDQLVFGDGTVAKFWGTNIAAYSLFQTPNDMIKVCRFAVSAGAAFGP